MPPIPLVYFGTSAFAVPILDRLFHDARFTVRAVVTQPDRPVGRKQQLEQPPVKIQALELGLPVLQFEKVKSDEAFETLKRLGGEVAVVASFGQIIPQRVLDLYPKGMVNVHASLLPLYRGASPIAAAIREGASETGISIMRMDALMDRGPILAKETEPIRPDDTTETLSARLALLGAATLPDVLERYAQGLLNPVEQEHQQATTVKLLTREDGELKPTGQTAVEMERLVRAYTPWPGTYYLIDGKRLKILAAHIKDDTKEPGTRMIVDGLPSLIGKDGRALVIDRLQPEGKPPMDGSAFLRGSRTWTTG